MIRKLDQDPLQSLVSHSPLTSWNIPVFESIENLAVAIFVNFKTNILKLFGEDRFLDLHESSEKVVIGALIPFLLCCAAYKKMAVLEAERRNRWRL